MSPEKALQIAQIGQIAIPVQNLDRAVAFYRDTLGLPFLFQVPNLAFFQCGEIRIMLSIPEGPNAPTKASILYYKVDDLSNAYQDLLDQGVKGIDPPHMIAKMADHDLWMAFFEDSEGNMLAFMSEVRG
jgi:catechol 2,3-dioxygenase-like lactoylglutathione lyase family enzyme